MKKISKEKKEKLFLLKESGESTKQIILNRANDIINESGMVDFRIDTLSMSLGLSPGNITYHFPKKEDISSALWDMCSKEIASASEHYITSLLDIKQLFLFYRFVISCFYRYKGIVCYRFGDLGVINKSLESNKLFIDILRHLFSLSLSKLKDNGYIKNIDDQLIKELIFRQQTICICWSINHATAYYANKKKQKGNQEEIISNKYAYAAIETLSMFFTESGKRQMDGITVTTKI